MISQFLYGKRVLVFQHKKDWDIHKIIISKMKIGYF